MTLTNFLLLLILSILTTYTFMNWTGIEKGSKQKIGLQFFLWIILFGLIVYGLSSINFIIQ